MGFYQAPGCGGSGAGYRGWKAADGKAVPECIGQAYSGNPGRRAERAGRADDGGRCQGIGGGNGLPCRKNGVADYHKDHRGFRNEKIDIYVATDLTPGSQHLDEDEYINVEAYTVDELCEKPVRGNRRFQDDFRDYELQGEIFM